MKGEFYKMEWEAWDEGTDELTLEQEAAYLRLCHQMYRRGGSLPENVNTIARLWRCHPNKVKPILERLIDAGKIVRQDGHLTNMRVRQELDARETRRTHRADAGRMGGLRSGDVRRKSLKNNDENEAFALVSAKQNEPEERRREERREESQGADAPEHLPDEEDREDSDRDLPDEEAAPAVPRKRPAPKLGPNADPDWPADGFDQLWALWPKTDRKKEAIAKVAKIRAEGLVTFDLLLRSAKSFLSYKRSEPGYAERFIPALVVWLNRDGWQDEADRMQRGPVASGGYRSRMKVAI